MLSVEFYNFTAIELSTIFIYIGTVQIIIQGFLIDKLTNRVGQEKLLIVGSMMMAISIFLMPLLKNLLFFYLINTILSAGYGIMNTTIPALISKKAKVNEQGRFLGVASSIAAIALIPGPLFSGLLIDIGSLVAPFFVSGFLLLASLIIGYMVYSQSTKIKLEQSNIKIEDTFKKRQ